MKQKAAKGQTLIELLIATAIFALIISPFVSSLANLTFAQVRYRHQIQAAQYAREALEIAYNIIINLEDTQAWDTFVADYADNGQVYHPTLTEPLSLMTGIELPIAGKFSRQIAFEKARRDNDTLDIDKNGAIIDSNTLKITVTVNWNDQGKTQDVKIFTYLINFKLTDI
ncbi:MAG TPA: prepilin-type N-terminal cleavage/methylation domain-containing protein [Candidatus Bathyarchaeia archaeon]|nr:prepilin-type N-terminal cleavage/methylation domain-containing protein [Candidatus Bathyarchaeia archaeon]